MDSFFAAWLGTNTVAEFLSVRLQQELQSFPGRLVVNNNIPVVFIEYFKEGGSDTSPANLREGGDNLGFVFFIQEDPCCL